MSATIVPDQIVREMAKLWMTLGKEGQAETGTPVLRACTMTLVVVAEESDDFQALGETIAALMPEHPARAIIIRLKGGAERELGARVFAQCWMPFGQRKQICCEQVEITASKISLDDVGSVLAPIVAPDLPVIIWCRSASAVERAEFRALVARTGKLVLDTAAWADSRAALRTLTALFAEGIALGDLAWTRLTRWRELLSQAFENRQYLSRLPAVSKITVAFGGAEPATSARYISAWVANSLESAGMHLPVMWEAHPEEPAGDLLFIELRGEDVRVEVACRENRLVLTTNDLSNCTNLPRATDYVLMREELGIVRHDPVFERVLATAARL